MFFAIVSVNNSRFGRILEQTHRLGPSRLIFVVYTGLRGAVPEPGNPPRFASTRFRGPGPAPVWILNKPYCTHIHTPNFIYIRTTLINFLCKSAYVFANYRCASAVRRCCAVVICCWKARYFVAFACFFRAASHCGLSNGLYMCVLEVIQVA